MQATREARNNEPATESADGARRSDCPISTVLDLIGDKWSLLIIRDLLVGKKRFGELSQSPEGITTSILATRLKWLQTCEFIEAVQYQSKPPRYEYRLTEKGRALHPVLQQIALWGEPVSTQHLASARQLHELIAKHLDRAYIRVLPL